MSTVVDVIEEMRSFGAALKAVSYADDENNDIVAVVYADGREAAENLLAAFALLEERMSLSPDEPEE
jgi:hypothetical protein